MHPFDESIALQVQADGRLTGNAPKAYWNVVGPFGGITAALLLQSVLRQDAMVGEPLVLTVNFTAPVLDVPFEITVEAAQTNRSTQHWLVQMRQQPGVDQPLKTVATATVVTGVRRDQWRLQTARRPVAIAVDKAKRRDRRAGLAWFDRYDLRFFENPIKADNPGEGFVTWVRDEPARTLDYPSLAAICDTLFPAIFAHQQKYIPIATVSMQVYFHTTLAELQAHAHDYLLVKGWSSVFHDGFSDSDGQVWAGERLIATTQQVMWYRSG